MSVLANETAFCFACAEFKLDISAKKLFCGSLRPFNCGPEPGEKEASIRCGAKDLGHGLAEGVSPFSPQW